jgi:hypothetical protein
MRLHITALLAITAVAVPVVFLERQMIFRCFLLA